MRSLLNDYAALRSTCPGVRYQTVFIDIHCSETFGLKIYYTFSLEHMARYKGHITPPEHFMAIRSFKITFVFYALLIERVYTY